MKRSHAPHAHMAPVDIVGIPEPHLREHLEHILAEDSAQGAEPQSLLGLARHFEDEGAPHQDLPPDEGAEGHEDMLPQLRLVDALLGKSPRHPPQPERRPFAELITAEQNRRQRRKRLSRPPDSVESLPPPSPQAENDRLLLEEIGRKPPHPSGGWVAETPEPSPPPVDTQDSSPPPAFSLGDEVMDGFVSAPVTPPRDMPVAETSDSEQTAPSKAEPSPPIALKVKRKEKTPTAPAEPPPPPFAKPAVTMKVKGKPRRPAAVTPPPVDETPPPPDAAPEVPAPPEDQAAAKPAVTMKVKGKPRRPAAVTPP
ncbi:MAG: hypothetical protein LDL39_17545, partial [Magnetospirillum sp.]|nr:hypothetical protein [Magnetospirillum sp.]